MAETRTMVRPTYLVVDPEHGGSISTRKLVLETAKLNVLTAYSGREAIETLRRFPALDGAVLDAAMRDMPCTELIRALKQIAPSLHVIAVGSPQQWDCAGADTSLNSFEPARLLDRIRDLHRPVVDGIFAEDARLSAMAE